MVEITEERDKELLKLLKKMDIPFYRKDKLDKNNLLWLQKNVGFKNSNKNEFQKVKEIIDYKIENKDYNS